MTSHDHNFKNVFLDFPKEALTWILPDIPSDLGTIQRVEFVRQEPKKQRLSDGYLSLDMPILYTFENGQVLLWRNNHKRKTLLSCYRPSDIKNYRVIDRRHWRLSITVRTILSPSPSSGSSRR